MFETRKLDKLVDNDDSNQLINELLRSSPDQSQSPSNMMMMTDDYTRMPNVYRPNGLIDKQTQGHIKNETFYGENNKPLLSNK